MLETRGSRVQFTTRTFRKVKVNTTIPSKLGLKRRYTFVPAPLATNRAELLESKHVKSTGKALMELGGEAVKADQHKQGQRVYGNVG